MLPSSDSLKIERAEYTNRYFSWSTDAKNYERIKIVIQLDLQHAIVYGDDEIIGKSVVSSGRKGHETPTGVFSILEKAESHHSRRYRNAAMPYMHRITEDGVALHGGNIPGHPTSRGCVRLPIEFAKLLFGVTSETTQVIIL